MMPTGPEMFLLFHPPTLSPFFHHSQVPSIIVVFSHFPPLFSCSVCRAFHFFHFYHSFGPRPYRPGQVQKNSSELHRECSDWQGTGHSSPKLTGTIKQKWQELTDFFHVQKKRSSTHPRRHSETLWVQSAQCIRVRCRSSSSIHRTLVSLSRASHYPAEIAANGSFASLKRVDLHLDPSDFHTSCTRSPPLRQVWVSTFGEKKQSISNEDVHILNTSPNMKNDLS